MNTLRGVFPEPKPVFKRNFIQENVRQIKKLQEHASNNKTTEPPPQRVNRYAHIPAKVTKYFSPNRRSLSTTSSCPEKVAQKPPINQPKGKGVKKLTRSVECIDYSRGNQQKINSDNTKSRDISIQTDFSHLRQIYCPQVSSPRSQLCGGDTTNKEEAVTKLNNLKLDKPKNEKKSPTQDKFKTYQRGVVPKYIRERQKELEPVPVMDPDCPPGHVTIPDAERKETLRALRQSYADLIAELNLLPVKTDTLRTRNRKIELEKQLNKIEEGIKVFSRPKVYVKINS